MDKAKKRSKILKIVTVLIAVVLVCFWSALAFITVNGVADAGAWNPAAGTKFIAHRGYSEKYFENTYQAFAAAGKESFFQGIETDVYMTKDGVFLCSHDDNPFVDKSIYISQSDYNDIKDLPLDLSGAKESVDLSINYRIATLSDYLSVCSVYRKTAFIEIKQNFTKEEAVKLSTYVLSRFSYTQTVFCSFNKDVIDYIYSNKRYVTIQLFTSSSVKAFFLTKMGYNIGVNKNILSKSEKSIERAHKKDLFIGAYTVNDAAEAKKLVAAGVDFITTDRVLEGF